MSKNSSKLEQFLLPERLERMEAALKHRTDSLTLVLDRIHHEHNIAAVLRSADAFGIQTVHFTGKRFNHSRGISLGAERWLDVHCEENENTLIEKLKSEGYKLVVLEPKDYAGDKTALAVHELPFDEKLALVFGSEKHGVSDGLKQAADISAHLEMYGFVESFNISVACALCLYTARMSISGPSKDLKPLSKDRARDTKGKWVLKDVRQGEKVLEELESRGKAQ